MTIPFQDPELPAPVHFGLDLRDGSGAVSRYTRQRNDDLGIVPRDIMPDVPHQVDVHTIEIDSDSESESDAARPPASVRLPSTRTSGRKKNVPGDRTSSSRTRKRKTPETPEYSSSLPSSSRTRNTRSRNTNAESVLACIAEFEEDDELDSASTTAVEISPPRKARPPNSGGSSPLKPKSVMTFAGYQCQMPGCNFSASSPQHIKHHYETFQHGRLQSLQHGMDILE